MMNSTKLDSGLKDTNQSLNPYSLQTRLQHYRRYHLFKNKSLASGYLTRMVGLTLEAVGINVPVGRKCEVILSNKNTIEVEVVGFNGDVTYLMPIEKVEGIEPGARVVPIDDKNQFIFGEHLRGRIINGIGQVLDEKGPLFSHSSNQKDTHHYISTKINPLHRHPIEEPLDVGIKAINGLLTVGKGQRIGLFAGSGVGKSMLMGMMTRFTKADIVVVGLIGERGREVKEFIDQILGKEGLEKSVVVAAPADDAPLMRLRAAELCTQIAEYFRDEGKSVLLLMDSLTRYGQAQREIALSIGEPPATKGYPPSVFSKIPELVERAGNGQKGSGSITAFYTVLTEGDDLQDPIADSSRAILDGHIVLSRRLAEEGVYPAIDIESSISRVMPNITDLSHLKLAQKFKKLLACYQANKDLITIGAYSHGSDPEIDEAIEKQSALKDYIAQDIQDSSIFVESVHQLKQLVSLPEQKVEGATGPLVSKGSEKPLSKIRKRKLG